MPDSALKALFDNYNAKWEGLSRTDKNYPLPTSTSKLYKLGFIGNPTVRAGTWTDEDIFVTNVQLLFLAGFGLTGTLSSSGDNLTIRISSASSKSKLEAMAKWLRRTEVPRWHPDRMNLRTGSRGSVDEAISKKKEVVAMRTAAQLLLEKVEKML